MIFPTLMFAADSNPFDTGLDKIGSWINKIAMLLIGVAVVVIFWGAIQFLFDVKGKKEEGKELLMWGIIALFIMVSLWGIIGILKKATVGENKVEIKSDLAIPGYGSK